MTRLDRTSGLRPEQRPRRRIPTHPNVIATVIHISAKPLERLSEQLPQARIGQVEHLQFIKGEPGNCIMLIGREIRDLACPPRHQPGVRREIRRELIDPKGVGARELNLHTEFLPDLTRNGLGW